MRKVAVLGVGRMGGAMARRLAAAGFEVSLWNRTREAASRLGEELAGLRVSVADRTDEAVADADAVLCSLANGEATTAVLLDPRLLGALGANAVVCDMGTSGVAVARHLADALRSRGVAFVDSPVSGSVATANAGELLVMASGDPEAVEVVREVLGAFAKQVTYLGAAGNGQAMKLAVNLVVHDLNAALSEGLLLATRAGIPAEEAYRVFQDSVVGSPFVNYKRAAFLEPAVAVAMSLDLVNKDLGLVVSTAQELGVPVPATRAVAATVHESCQAGFGGSDMSALKRFLAGEPGPLLGGPR